MLKLLYQQDDYPIFQNRMYDSIEEAVACPKGNIRLVEDLETGLVYNSAFCPDLMTYDGNYQNEQAISPVFQQHLEIVSTTVKRTMGQKRLVEVGCGKGYFLEMLLSKGFDVTGFDPTYEGINPKIRRQYFSADVVEQAEGIILRHVLEHIQNPIGFLEQLKVANGGNGKIYIEVPCFEWICENRAWFDIFYEHANYFRLADFDRMFGKVIESGRIFGGQYIYVIAELSSLKIPKIDINSRVVFPSNFSINFSDNKVGEKNQTVIWGGSSKGVIFSLLKSRAGYPISTVIDINPAKQGKFLPGTGLQVQSPAVAIENMQKGTAVYVMNSNYLDEIKKMSGNIFRYILVEN